jgi:hypothetical protein
MKKTLSLLTILCLFLVQTTKAQLQKGNVLVGADLAGFEFDLGKSSGFDISISPKAAWFIKDNVAIGAYALLAFTKSGEGAPTTTTYSVGPLGRYYVNKPDMNLLKSGRWFAEVNAGITGVNVSEGGGSTNGLGFGFGPGYAYFITPNIGLETLLKYNGLLGFGDETYQSRLALNIGFQIYLPGKATLNKVKSTEGL